MSSAWARGSTRAWRRTRVLVLARDNYRCTLKIEGVCVGAASQAHHLHGRGSACLGCRADLPSHLSAACAPCNLRVGEPKSEGDPGCRPMTRW